MGELSIMGLDDELEWMRPVPLEDLQAAVLRMRHAQGHASPEDTEIILKGIRLGQVDVHTHGDVVLLYLRDPTRNN